MRKLEFVALIRSATSAWRLGFAVLAGASLKTSSPETVIARSHAPRTAATVS
ncbi:MAG: hypothetical protein WAK55_07040 [Xanthobacteraceae bacterium]|jgi:hypothetical protein